MFEEVMFCIRDKDKNFHRKTKACRSAPAWRAILTRAWLGETHSTLGFLRTPFWNLMSERLVLYLIRWEFGRNQHELAKLERV